MDSPGFFASCSISEILTWMISAFRESLSGSGEVPELPEVAAAVDARAPPEPCSTMAECSFSLASRLSTWSIEGSGKVPSSPSEWSPALDMRSLHVRRRRAEEERIPVGLLRG